MNSTPRLRNTAPEKYNRVSSFSFRCRLPFSFFFFLYPFNSILVSSSSFSLSTFPSDALVGRWSPHRAGPVWWAEEIEGPFLTTREIWPRAGRFGTMGVYLAPQHSIFYAVFRGKVIFPQLKNIAVGSSYFKTNSGRLDAKKTCYWAGGWKGSAVGWVNANNLELGHPFLEMDMEFLLERDKLKSPSGTKKSVGSLTISHLWCDILTVHLDFMPVCSVYGIFSKSQNLEIRSIHMLAKKSQPEHVWFTACSPYKMSFFWCIWKWKKSSFCCPQCIAMMRKSAGNMMMIQLIWGLKTRNLLGFLVFILRPGSRTTWVLCVKALVALWTC